MQTNNRVVLFLASLALLAATAARAQENLYKHVYWEVEGNRSDQALGLGGLDTLGLIGGAQHALSVSENYSQEFGGTPAWSRLVLNRFPMDTARQYMFPGQKVIRCSLNSLSK